VLPRLRSDLLDLLLRATRPGGLAGVELEWDARAAVTVVLASRGYPESSSSGDVIAGSTRPDGVEVTTRARRSATARSSPPAGGCSNVTALGDDVGRPGRRVCCRRRDRVRRRQLRRDIAA
jgi:phosphoribosylamine--glycine ligase